MIQIVIYFAQSFITI